jgi:hypothetical protein
MLNGMVRYFAEKENVVIFAPTKIMFTNSLHESIVGFEKMVAISAQPELAIWHIKSVEKQDNRWEICGTR